ncbi:MAG: glycosyltransferase [Phaeodactylibacter sp.]|nr:glycosyltransferase [Phaeodactylibacter sp.]MCB9263866.1 glycosyltransferase [Lewinellaceae bacterium]MCB9288208.1 glycosyltransferase [Lewinellaceae bacterium]
MISILLPVFNNGPFLEECLDSILSQSETGWELIAVDDYSTDNSRKIIQRFALRDSRIRMRRNTGPKGIIPALRLALKYSRGSYITRMDADDLMPADKLRRLKRLLQEHGPSCIATGKVRYFSEGELGEGYRKYERWLNGLMDNGRHYEEIYKECPLPSPCWMAYREALLICGAFGRDVYPEDYDLAFRFYKHRLRIVASGEVLHLWRDHSGRASRNQPAYADPTFLGLKLKYFLEIDHRPGRPLVVWGAGRKGKSTAKFLQQEGVHFSWVCNTPSKWGKDIYGIRIQPVEAIASLDNPQVIVLVAAPDAQPGIRMQLQEWGLETRKNFFFFS